MKLKKIVVVLVCLTVIGLEARYHRAGGESSFNRVLDNNELVVVMFYEGGKEMRNQLNDFKSAGRGEKYVAYVSVDLGKSDLSSLGDTYNVKKMPTFLLIRNGAMYKNGRSTLVGEQSSSAIRNFVRDAFGDYIEDIKEKKREEAYENRPSVSFGVGYGYPYYGYGYPYYGYYGYPYYYGRPGVSFGIGF